MLRMCTCLTRLRDSLLFCASLTGALACQKSSLPADFRLEIIPMITSSDPARVLVRSLTTSPLPPNPKAEYPFEVVPNDVGQIDRFGTFVCKKSGDALIRLARREAKVSCRLVDRVDASNVGRVELMDGPFVPKVKILGKNGEEFPDVELQLSSKNSGILFPRGRELVPKEVGTATVIARAGQASREFTVDVVRRVRPEALPLEQNRKIFFSLEPGKYELRIALASTQKLVAEWREAPYCNYSKTATDHVSICLLRKKGGVVFDNPLYLTRGSTEVSDEGVTIFEVP